MCVCLCVCVRAKCNESWRKKVIELVQLCHRFMHFRKQQKSTNLLHLSVCVFELRRTAVYIRYASYVHSYGVWYVCKCVEAYIYSGSCKIVLRFLSRNIAKYTFFVCFYCDPKLFIVVSRNESRKF